MWKNTRMIILAAVCASIYGAALIAFKTAIPLIPGITEVRVANIFPMTFGLLFGPAGAWGSAIGNLIGDVFGGTLGPSSIAGFVGNFLLGYLPYTMWTTLVPFAEKSREWKSGSWRSWKNIAQALHQEAAQEIDRLVTHVLREARRRLPEVDGRRSTSHRALLFSCGTMCVSSQPSWAARLSSSVSCSGLAWRNSPPTD